MTTDAEIQSALPALASGNVAVITGGASGIGLAAAKRLAAM
ncbi:MAG: short-chain dehydrogenase, partial [Mesorhizobium sp.]